MPSATEVTGRRATGSCAISSTAASFHSRRVSPPIPRSKSWGPKRRWRHRRSKPMGLRERIEEEELRHAFDQNEKLVNALYEAREQISSLKEEVDKLPAPPSTYGVYLSSNLDGTVNVLSQGRKVKVSTHPAIDVKTLRPGQELVLNEGLNVVEAAGYEIQGDVVILKEQLDLERAVVTLRADEEKVGIIADPLRTTRLKIGDHILMDAKSGYLLEKLPKSEVEDLALEEVPDIGYDDIGGLGTQIEAIKDAVELPYLYADYYKEHQLTPPKGGGADRQCIEAVLPLATDEVRVDVRAPSRSAMFRYGQHVSAVERVFTRHNPLVSKSGRLSRVITTRSH